MGRYRNIFLEYGYPAEEIQRKKDLIWYEIFEGPEKVYYEEDPELGYVLDTGNDDVRTEGMSYAMLLAVEYDRKDIFDRLWGWVKKYMYLENGFHAHYFAWSVSPDGQKNSYGPAPDGEEFFALSLFFARNRWGNGEGIFNYSQEAQNLLSYCVHKGERYAGLPMWNRENKLIKFIPEVDFTDPSYHCPHFYQQFALYANEEDRKFWTEAAFASREYLKKAMNEKTGLSPEYGHYDGTPVFDKRNHPHFFSDAYRTALNVAVDSQWFGGDDVLKERLTKLQEFFATTAKGKENFIYTVAGENTGEEVLHPVGLLATLASASAAIPEGPYAQKFVAEFWQTPLRTGVRRYYDNFLYAFSYLGLSGNYKMF